MFHYAIKTTWARKYRPKYRKSIRSKMRLLLRRLLMSMEKSWSSTKMTMKIQPKNLSFKIAHRVALISIKNKKLIVKIVVKKRISM